MMHLDDPDHFQVLPGQVPRHVWNKLCRNANVDPEKTGAVLVMRKSSTAAFVLNWGFLDQSRVRHGPYASDSSYGFNGMFEFALEGEPRRIRCIASDGLGWQHVSVSFGAGSKATPSWELMCRIKDLFFEDEDTVIQFHPKKSEYVNVHQGCLHLWRVIDGREQPTPPKNLVG